MARRPLTRKWNPLIHKKVKDYLKAAKVRSRLSRSLIPNGLTMPDPNAIVIGGAKKMDAAILFFDLESFTKISATLSTEQTLALLNFVIPSVMHVVRHWGGFFEKNTGDGVMAILGTETKDRSIIAQEAIECAMAIRYVTENEVQPMLASVGLPHINFRVGIDLGEVLIGRIGIHSHNFLSVVGTIANLACKLQGLARSNGICIGDSLVRCLNPYLQIHAELGEHPDWAWQYTHTGQAYNYYHFNLDWPEPLEWFRRGFINQPTF
ncbi:adenylate/guanylate cyclase domain-containing protein [Geobacter anodireducens]